jgi:hypothetical protein
VVDFGRAQNRNLKLAVWGERVRPGLLLFGIQCLGLLLLGKLWESVLLGKIQPLLHRLANWLSRWLMKLLLILLPGVRLVRPYSTAAIVLMFATISLTVYARWVLPEPFGLASFDLVLSFALLMHHVGYC